MDEALFTLLNHLMRFKNVLFRHLVWFLMGSFFFLNDSLVESGTWLFVVGSAKLIIKPIIKLISLVHVGILHKVLV